MHVVRLCWRHSKSFIELSHERGKKGISSFDIDKRRNVYRTPKSKTAAAETTVRLPGRTSANTCIRFTSRSLIEINLIPLVSFLMGEDLTFLKSACTATIHKLRYKT
jgi:hypothetical protein